MTRKAIISTIKVCAAQPAAIQTNTLRNLQNTVLNGYWKKDRVEVLSVIEDKIAVVTATAQHTQRVKGGL